jgi:hypothetical protein
MSKLVNKATYTRIICFNFAPVCDPVWWRIYTHLYEVLWEQVTMSCFDATRDSLRGENE